MKKIMIKEKNKSFDTYTRIILKSVVNEYGTMLRSGEIDSIRALYWFQKNNKGEKLTSNTKKVLRMAKYYFYIRHFKEYKFLEDEELLDKILIKFNREYTLKELKKEKELFNYYKHQLDRIEELLISRRSYSYENWKYIYTENTLMKEIASSLLWGSYKNQNLEKAFIFKDGEFLNLNGDSVSISKDEFITLVHPIELSEDDLKSWDKVFKKQKIKQVFKQLKRDIYFQEETDIIDITKGSFKTKKLENSLHKKGWFMYYTEGFFDGYYKDFDNYNVGFRFGYEKGMFNGDNKVSGVVEDNFYSKPKDAKIIKDVFPAIHLSYYETYGKDVKDAKIISDFKTINKIFYSEICRELSEIVNNSKE